MIEVQNLNKKIMKILKCLKWVELKYNRAWRFLSYLEVILMIQELILNKLHFIEIQILHKLGPLKPSSESVDSAIPTQDKLSKEFNFMSMCVEKLGKNYV